MYPLTFTPILKQTRWGGRRLGDVLGKPIGTADDYAESWEISDHGDDLSVVRDGDFAGWTLRKLLKTHKQELLGADGSSRQFPLLIKYLDCHDRLSVQVHPCNRLARQIVADSNGKTEAWVVMQADPGSVIFAGFQEGVTQGDFELASRTGEFEKILHRSEPRAGDCYFIPAGVVHALGEGVLVAEIQQTCDITYRLHDWGRLDRNGNARPLHIEQATACVTFPQLPLRPISPCLECAAMSGKPELLVESDYFKIRRFTFLKDDLIAAVPVCRILMTVRGSGRLVCGPTQIDLKMGQTVLLPATCPDAEIKPSDPAGVQVLLTDVHGQEH